MKSDNGSKFAGVCIYVCYIICLFYHLIKQKPFIFFNYYHSLFFLLGKPTFSNDAISFRIMLNLKDEARYLGIWCFFFSFLIFFLMIEDIVEIVILLLLIF